MNKVNLTPTERFQILAVLVLKQVLTFNEFCIYADISDSYGYKLTSQRLIKHYTTGKLLFFKKDEVDEFLISNPVKTISNIEEEANSYLVNAHRNRGGKMI